MKQVESISIGIFSESFTPVTNGVAVSIATQRESLQRRGHKTYVFAPQHPKRDPAEKDVFRFPSVTPPGISEYPLALPYLPSLLLRANTTLPNLHIIHTHTPFVLAAYLQASNYPAEASVPGFAGFARAVALVQTGPDLASAGTGYCRVTVTVSWTDGRAQARSLALATVLTDYTP